MSLKDEPLRMSQKLREELEYIAGLCNNGESHVAGDAIERLLGYEVDHEGNPARHGEDYGDDNES